MGRWFEALINYLTAAGYLPDARPVAAQTALAHVDTLALSRAVATAMESVSHVNRYLERTAHWREAKAGHEARVATILYTACEALRLVSVLLHPVLLERAVELCRRLGWAPPKQLDEGLVWGALVPGASVMAGPPLFPRAVGS